MRGSSQPVTSFCSTSASSFRLLMIVKLRLRRANSICCGFDLNSRAARPRLPALPSQSGRASSDSSAPQQDETLVNGALAIRAVAARLGERAAVLADLIGSEAVDVRLAIANQLLGILVEQLEVVGCVEHPALPVEPEPADVCFDR